MVVLLMKYGADSSMRDGEGCSCIHLAAQFGHTAIVAYLVAKGANVNLMDKNGMTPLMWSAYRVTRSDFFRIYFDLLSLIIFLVAYLGYKLDVFIFVRLSAYKLIYITANSSWTL